MRRTLYEADHEAFRESFRTLPRQGARPAPRRVGRRRHRPPRAVHRRGPAAGFLGMDMPEEYGGGGVRDFRFNAIIIEEMLRAAGAAAPGSGSRLHNDICLPYFLAYCTEEQKQRWLPGIASGELITAIAMTEPGTGSDLAGDRDHGASATATTTSSTARRRSSPTGSTPTWSITAVKTDPTAAPHGACRCSSLERGHGGLQRGRNLDKLGQHAQDTAELFFNDVRVPVENLLGRGGPGLHAARRRTCRRSACRSPSPRVAAARGGAGR